jgi:beta-galactosidase
VDGMTWEELYEKECTGWDFKPVKQNKLMKYFRVTILDSSEGHAGLAEITLFH